MNITNITLPSEYLADQYKQAPSIEEVIHDFCTQIDDIYVQAVVWLLLFWTIGRNMVPVAKDFWKNDKDVGKYLDEATRGFICDIIDGIETIFYVMSMGCIIVMLYIVNVQGRLGLMNKVIIGACLVVFGLIVLSNIIKWVRSKRGKKDNS